MNADGKFSGALPWWKTAPLRRPIKRSMVYQLGGHFSPEKKIFSPPPPHSPQRPSWPLAPPALTRPGDPPTPGIFNKKSRPPPSRRLGLPFPSPEQKKIINIRNVHQEISSPTKKNMKVLHPPPLLLLLRKY